MDLRCIVLPLFLAPGLFANEAVDRAHQYEDVGDSAMVRDVYSKALEASPRDPELLNAYAQTLERYRDPGAREAYRKSAVLWKSAGRAPDALAAERRAVLLDLIAGDHAAAKGTLRNTDRWAGGICNRRVRRGRRQTRDDSDSRALAFVRPDGRHLPGC